MLRKSALAPACAALIFAVASHCNAAATNTVTAMPATAPGAVHDAALEAKPVTITPVPEPSSVGFVVAGALALCIRQTRIRRRRS